MVIDLITKIYTAILRKYGKPDSHQFPSFSSPVYRAIIQIPLDRRLFLTQSAKGLTILFHIITDGPSSIMRPQSHLSLQPHRTNQEG